MELAIALLSGATGGSLISGISPKFSIAMWLSVFGGMVGGGMLYALFARIMMPGGVKAVGSVDLYSLLTILIIGFVGGIFMLLPIVLMRWRRHR